MKYIITIILLILALNSFSQGVPFFKIRSDQSIISGDYYLYTGYQFKVPRGCDTIGALRGGRDSLGLLYYDSCASILYVRVNANSSTHKWQAQGRDLWTLSGSNLYPVSTSYNVGIGTISPTAKLDVLGRISVYDDLIRLNALIGKNAGESYTNGDVHNTAIGTSAQRFAHGDYNTSVGTSTLEVTTGDNNTAIGHEALFLTDSSDNIGVGFFAGVSNYGKQNISIGSLSNNSAEVDNETVNNSTILVGSASMIGSSIGTLITNAGLSIGQKYTFLLTFNGTAPEPFLSEGRTTVYTFGTVTNSTTITFRTTFTTQGTGTTTIKTFSRQNNSIAIGYNVSTNASNQIAIGNSDATLFKVGGTVAFDLVTTPTTGYVLTWDGAKYIPAAGGGGGGGVSLVSGTTPIHVANGGSTPIVSIDIANGSQSGAISNTDWSAFNNKVPTGAITSSGLTMSTARLLGRTTASTGAIEQITVGSGLSLSGGILTATGSGGSVTLVSGVNANGFTFSIANATTTPVITLTLQNATTSQSGQLTNTDWNAFNNKQNAVTGAITPFLTSNATANRAAIFDGTGKLAVSSVTSTELGFSSGVTSAIQTQLNNKEPLITYAFQTLTDGATITLNGNNGINFTVTLAGNRTLALSNITAGKTYVIEVNQDVTGNRHLTLPANSKVLNGAGSGTSVTLSTTSLAKDMLTMIYDGTNYIWSVGYNAQ